MDTAVLYADTRERLLALASELTVEQVGGPVPALPGWTVKDTYAHLTGLCGDVLDRRLEGMGTPPWTAVHLAARTDRSLDEISAEWAALGPRLDDRLAAEAPPGSVFPAIDVWSHEQDIRGAVGLRGRRDDLRIRFLVEVAAGAFDTRFIEAEVPALVVVVVQPGGRPESPVTFGSGGANVVWRTSGYELLRTLFGRRSQAQIEAADWDGDPAPYLDHLHLFDLPVADLVD